ncbi:MAG: hypothetical protein ACXIUL_00145 [Wenzhouxiangella sp.]
MKLITIALACLFSAQLLAGPPLSIPERVYNPGILNPGEFFESREFEEFCPKETESITRIINSYLTDRVDETPRKSELIAAFDLPEIGQDDFVLLESSKHGNVCAQLNQWYKPSIDLMVQVHPDMEPVHPYEIAYYWIEKHGMFAAVVYRETIIWVHKTEERVYLHTPSGLGTHISFFDENLDLIVPRDVLDHQKSQGKN